VHVIRARRACCNAAAVEVYAQRGGYRARAYSPCIGRDHCRGPLHALLALHALHAFPPARRCPAEVSLGAGMTRLLSDSLGSLNGSAR
jgi:hypothetical protein